MALLVHLAVAAALLCGLGVDAVATAAAPLAALVDAGGAPALGVLVRIGAAVACGSHAPGGARGGFAHRGDDGRRGELPRVLATPGRGGSLWRADLVGGAAAVVVVATLGPVGALTVASCALLVHYALVGMAAVLLPAGGAELADLGVRDRCGAVRAAGAAAPGARARGHDGDAGGAVGAGDAERPAVARCAR